MDLGEFMDKLAKVSKELDILMAQAASGGLVLKPGSGGGDVVATLSRPDPKPGVRSGLTEYLIRRLDTKNGVTGVELGKAAENDGYRVGSVYPTLAMLVRQGCVKTKVGDDGLKVYSLTAAGLKRLDKIISRI